MILFKRNAKGKPIFWKILDDNGGKIIVNYGNVGSDGYIETIDKKLVKANEIDSRIRAKRKEGYKELSELRDNAPEVLKGDDLYNYLNSYLPINNTTDTGFVLPMLCKVLDNNKPFKKNSYFGQWKINGARCIIGIVKNDYDLFNPLRLTYHSREGEEWNLNYLDDIILPYLDKELIESMVEEDVCLDGELYIPGLGVNEINSAIKNKDNPLHYQLQFWCYDICINNMSAIKRSQFRFEHIKRHVFGFADKMEHFNNKNPFILLPNVRITGFNNCIYYRDKFINLGFEGLVIRKDNAEYQFGKRNQCMMKFKKIHDGKFIIIDIVPEGVRKYLPKFVLKNDINEETFECTYNASHEEQERVFKNKNYYIGRQAFVEYRERSGIKGVPFHAKIIRLI